MAIVFGWILFCVARRISSFPCALMVGQISTCYFFLVCVEWKESVLKKWQDLLKNYFNPFSFVMHSVHLKILILKIFWFFFTHPPRFLGFSDTFYHIFFLSFLLSFHVLCSFWLGFLCFYPIYFPSLSHCFWSISFRVFPIFSPIFRSPFISFHAFLLFFGHFSAIFLSFLKFFGFFLESEKFSGLFFGCDQLDNLAFLVGITPPLL